MFHFGIVEILKGITHMLNDTLKLITNNKNIISNFYKSIAFSVGLDYRVK